MHQPPPLAGIRVLDLSRIIAGPNCTMQLGDLGAEVIKVEHPKGGDDTRHMRPPEAGGEAHFFLAYNRNKKSIAVDMKSAEGLDIVRRLAARSDVVIENFRPGVTGRLGIDYAALSKDNPGLIYCSISAYGQTGPMADRPGLDPVLQAEMGLMSLNGEPDGVAMRHPVSLTDLVTSLLASTAICAALVRKRAGGGGEHIDLSLMGAAVTMLANLGQYYLTGGEDPPRAGNSHPSAVPVSAFHGSDGEQFYTACGTQNHCRILLEDVLDRADLLDDPRFATNAQRVTNREAMMPVLDEIFATRPRDHWVAAIQAAGLPAGPVRTISDALESPEVAAAGLVQTLTHTTAGDIRLLRSPLNLANTAPREDSPPPTLGQHTDAVLSDLIGLDDDELVWLREAGTIA